MDTGLELNNPGKDIAIPVQMIFPSHAGSSDGGPQNLKNNLRAENAIQQMWTNLEAQEVPPGELRTTFVQIMIADFC
ncbi:hypothetical protein PI124_g11523 [Phytophthora idaei]|nr:hypothetical protein PI125_g11018 [Phytophthora idaei]KAG3154565.1 hypothetical protein PI126_g9558 [Phytophthora idaei]KAG3243679.1 hypothetical protein PI124_g11523 [Phytophthora idaei]